MIYFQTSNTRFLLEALEYEDFIYYIQFFFFQKCNENYPSFSLKLTARTNKKILLKYWYFEIELHFLLHLFSGSLQIYQVPTSQPLLEISQRDKTGEKESWQRFRAYWKFSPKARRRFHVQLSSILNKRLLVSSCYSLSRYFIHFNLKLIRRFIWELFLFPLCYWF